MTITAARAFVGRTMGLPASFDGSVAAYRDLTAAQQVELTKQLVAYVNANPQQFTPAQVTTAAAEAGRAQTLTMDDTSYDWAVFVDTALDRGNSILGVAGMTLGTGVILAACVFAAVYAFQLAPRTAK